MEKIVLGALGGLCAVLVKFLGQDYSSVVAHAANLSSNQILAYKVGYGILTPILMFLGAFVAWVSDEHKRVKIVALAVAAPAIITTWSGGHSGWGEPAESRTSQSSHGFVASAYADQIEGPPPGLTPEYPDAVTSKSVADRINDGIAIFFGYGNVPPSYSVIAGTFQDGEAARQLAAQLNSKDSNLHAWVGQGAQPRSGYAVVVGERSPLSQARELRQKALDTRLLPDAYLSSVPLRQAAPHAG